jgi:hypothetical protein
MLIQCAAVSLMKVNAVRDDRGNERRVRKYEDVCNGYRYTPEGRCDPLRQFKRGPGDGRIISGTVSIDMR